jgi:hypothetical protein
MSEKQHEIICYEKNGDTMGWQTGMGKWECGRQIITSLVVIVQAV